MRNLSPIVLFVYKRLAHTKATVEALRGNLLADQSQLFIYSDAPKNKHDEEDVLAVRRFVSGIKGFRNVTVIKRERNLGLATSIISGVSEVLKKYGRVIVLEDDLQTGKYFLKYMNDALDFYQTNAAVFSITGYALDRAYMNFPPDYGFDTFVNIRPMSWSWATWQDRWECVDWSMGYFSDFIGDPKRIAKFNAGGTDLTPMLTMQNNGQIDSWYVRWSYHAIMNNKLTVYPTVSLIHNAGFDGTGVHCRFDTGKTFSHDDLSDKCEFRFVDGAVVDLKLVRRFNSAFNVKRGGSISAFAKSVLKALLGRFNDPFSTWLKKLLRAKFQQFKHRVRHLKLGYLAVMNKCEVGNYVTVYDNSVLNNCVIGDMTYIAVNTSINNARIGKFCSIGPDCRIGLYKHPAQNFVSTHPAFFSLAKQAQITFTDKQYFKEFEDIEIGNDVWIGARVMILDGVRIGDGSIIAAGSVVTRDVKPYTIVGGVPAKEIRKRFSDETIQRLLAIRWWDKDLSYIRKHFALFREIDLFLKEWVE